MFFSYLKENPKENMQMKYDYSKLNQYQLIDSTYCSQLYEDDYEFRHYVLNHKPRKGLHMKKYGEYWYTNTGLLSDERAGTEAQWQTGAKNNAGYRHIIGGVFIHRIINKLFHKNPVPQEFIETDHIDHNRQNNTADNLRHMSLKLNRLMRRSQGAWLKKVCVYNNGKRIYQKRWIPKVGYQGNHYYGSYVGGTNYYPNTTEGEIEAKRIGKLIKQKLFEELYKYEIVKSKINRRDLYRSPSITC